MRIDRLQVEGFLRIRHLDVTLTGPLHLFAGRNEAGKSTLREAVRFALDGTTPRVERKGERGRLISEGAKRGRVTIHANGGKASRNVRDGKVSGDLDALPGDVNPIALDLALGSRTFMELVPEGRRGLLFEVLGVEFSRDVIVQRLDRAGVHPKLLERVRPMLAAGFEAVVPEAKAKVTELRGAWEEVTGERWGSQKGEDWESPDLATEAPDDQQLTEARAALEEAEEAARDGRTLAGERTGELRQAERNRERSAGNATADAIRERLDLARTELADAEEQEAAAEAAYTEAAEALEALPPPPSAEEREQLAPAQPCPSCSTMLTAHLDDEGDLGALTTGELPELPEDQHAEERERLSREKAALGPDLPRLRSRVTDKRQRVTELERDLATLDGAPEAMSEEELEELRSSAQALSEAAGIAEGVVDQRREQLRKLEQQASARSRAAEATQRASKLHRAIIAWQQVAELMGSDGIPGELLAEALDPFNARLAELAGVAGWPTPKVTGSMDVQREGISYGLLSESARWRCDTLLAAAVAEFAGLGFLALDRVDVLDLPNRGKLVALLEALGTRFDQVLAFGTFKQRPELEGVATYWLERGALDDLEVEP